MSVSTSKSLLGNGKIPFYDKIRLRLSLERPELSTSGEEQGRDGRGRERERASKWERESEITLSQIKSQSVIFRSNCLEPLLDSAKNSVCICILFSNPLMCFTPGAVCGERTPIHANTLFFCMNGGRIAAHAAQRQFAICHSAQQIWGDGVNTSCVCPVEAHSALH